MKYRISVGQLLQLCHQPTHNPLTPYQTPKRAELLLRDWKLGERHVARHSTEPVGHLKETHPLKHPFLSLHQPVMNHAHTHTQLGWPNSWVYQSW